VALLGAKVGPGWASGLTLESSMHALVTPVLLGFTWLDGFGKDAESDPPSAEASEPGEADGSEGRSVVRADDGGESEITKGVDKDWPGEFDGGGVEALASEEVSAEAILDGEGIAVAPVAHLEVALEVSGPYAVGLIEGRQRLAGVAGLPGAFALLGEEVVALENTVDGAASGSDAELLQDELTGLPGSPSELLSELDDALLDGLRSGVRAGVGAVRSIIQALESLFDEPVPPGVASRSADVVAPAGVGETESALLNFEDEANTLLVHC
jgi:hypothetical protein